LIDRGNNLERPCGRLQTVKSDRLREPTRELPDLIISPPPEVISAAAAAAAAAGPGEVCALGASFIDGQGAALQGLAIQAGDRALNVFAFAKLDKTESSGSPRHLVADHHCRGYLKTRVGDKLAKRGIGGAVG
jgi:hypothetical protein